MKKSGFMKLSSFPTPNAQFPVPNFFSLYVHIPYCLVKCPYCDFNVYAAKHWPEEQYVNALCAEFRYYAAQAPWHGQPIKTIYFGGGTPSLFAPTSIERFLHCVTDCCSLVADAEISLEADPASVSREKLVGYRAVGVNRLSFGVQSFQAPILKTLGRLHTVDDVHHSLSWVRESNFDNVSLDLIFAVPGQTRELLSDDLAHVFAYGPTHVSTYCLTYEERTPFFTWREKGTLHPVSEDDEVEMFTLVQEQCRRAGYHHYEISSFARPGFRSRHNSNYWQGGSYLGLGAGAHSYANEPAWGRRWNNERHPRRYIERALTRGDAVSIEETLSCEQAMGEFLFLQLRQLTGFFPSAFAERFGVELHETFPHLSEGLLTQEEGKIKLSEHGLLLADSVFSSFF